MELYSLLEEFDPKLKKDDKSYKNLVKTVAFLETKKKVLFLTTSNRGEWAIKELKEEPFVRKFDDLKTQNYGAYKSNFFND